MYGYIYDVNNNEIEINDSTKPLDFSWNPYFEEGFKFYDKTLVEEVNKKNIECHRFFTLLCICHTVMSEVKDGVGLTYQAQSPDEAALVSAARNFGFVFKSRTPKSITVEILGEEKIYEVLNILDFNNVRKRMSVICRVDGRCVLYCKGADTVIKERLAQDSLLEFRETEEHLNVSENTSNRSFFDFEYCHHNIMGESIESPNLKILIFKGNFEKFC